MTRQVRLTVAVGLAVVAVGLFVTGVAKARIAAASSRSKDNLRTISHGIFAFTGAYGFFPGNGGPPQEAGRPDRRVMLRSQSGDGLLVRKAGLAQYCCRRRNEDQGAEDP